jgi:hypothetical protein
MKYDKVSQWTGQIHTAMSLQNLWLEYLYTEFILHTLLASSSELNREKLIITAHEIVNTVLLPTRQRDLLHSHRADIEWAVSGMIRATLEFTQASNSKHYRSLCSMLCLVPVFWYWNFYGRINIPQNDST